MVSESKSRLSRSQWLDHALKILASDGHGALKADTLSKSLKVSRGSFYWHFKNLAEFHRAVLQQWYAQAFSAAVAQIDASAATSSDRMRLVITLANEADSSLEEAVRAWAISNEQAHDVVASIDKSRLAYLESVLIASGMSRQRAFARANLAYLSYLGLLTVRHPLSEAERQSVTEELVQLVTQPESGA